MTAFTQYKMIYVYTLVLFWYLKKGKNDFFDDTLLGVKNIIFIHSLIYIFIQFFFFLSKIQK